MSLVFTRLFVLDKNNKKHEKAYKAGIRAHVNVEINDLTFRNGYKVMDHGRGLWVAPPSDSYTYKDKKGEEQTVRTPTCGFKNSAHEDVLKEDIIKAYKGALKGETAKESKLEPAY